jgi:CheY-like chemotaxis protein
MRILVVDDNEDAALTLAHIFKLEKHDVDVAHDGQAALEMVSIKPPRVVVLDIGMPGLNGYDVAERLRASPDGASLLIVAVTGWGNPADRAKAKAAGFDLHFTKPADPIALLSAVKRFEAGGR